MPVGERVFAPQAFGDARSGVIVAPFQFTLDGNDNLRIVSVNSVVGVRVIIQGRRLSEAGVIEPFSYSHTPATNRSAATQVFVLGRGALLNLAVFVEGATPLIGQTFVILQIVRGALGPLVLLGTLLQGYVTSTQGLGWPGSPIQDSVSAGGVYRLAFGTTPAAGSDLTETVPTGARWRLVGLAVSLTTTAGVGNRTPVLFYGSSLGSYVWSPLAAPVPASSSPYLTWASGLALPSTLSASFPGAGLALDSTLPAGFRFGTFTIGMAAGDQYGQPIYLIQEWLEVP